MARTDVSFVFESTMLSSVLSSKVSARKRSHKSRRGDPSPSLLLGPTATKPAEGAFALMAVGPVSKAIRSLGRRPSHGVEESLSYLPPRTMILLRVSSLRKCLTRLKATGNSLGARTETRQWETGSSAHSVPNSVVRSTWVSGPMFPGASATEPM